MTASVWIDAGPYIVAACFLTCVAIFAWALCAAAADADAEAARALDLERMTRPTAPADDPPSAGATHLYLVGPSTVEPDFDEEWARRAKYITARARESVVRDPDGWSA
jgi:hypothetical protein